jgi:hypothetical protein
METIAEIQASIKSKQIALIMSFCYYDPGSRNYQDLEQHLATVSETTLFTLYMSFAFYKS